MRNFPRRGELARLTMLGVVVADGGAERINPRSLFKRRPGLPGGPVVEISNAGITVLIPRVGRIPHASGQLSQEPQLLIHCQVQREEVTQGETRPTTRER